MELPGKERPMQSCATPIRVQEIEKFAIAAGEQNA
jgi:hypothetical protein